MSVISMKQLLEAGVHFGHQTRRWNPKMAPYIFTERNGIHIIDLQKSVGKVDEAYRAVFEIAAQGGTILFVGTKKQAQDAVKTEAERCGMYYVNERWLGGMLTNSINHIIKDADGGIWMATMRGLAYVQNPLQPGAIKNYNERYGIKDSHIRAISQDKQGNIWVSMFSGIACLNIHKQRFYNYDYESGIPTSNFVEASAVTTPDGTIYFGSPGGICFFNPQQLTEPKAVSPIQIINCERVGKLADQFASRLISPNKEGIICLNHDDNTFKINFTIKDFSQEGNVEYSYMMKGLDDQWYETEGDNEVTFRNLKPGDYTFIM